MSDPSFLGCPPALLAAVGQAVLAHSRLDALSVVLAESLAIPDAGGLTPAARLEASRQQAQRQMPPWATVGAAEVVGWCDTALMLDAELTARRAAAVAPFVDDEEVMTAQPLMSPPAERAPRGAADLGSLSLQTAAHCRAGRHLSLGLLHRIREGVYVRHPGLLAEGEAGVVIHYLSGERRWPDRPGEEELTAWWAEYSLGTGTWPRWPEPPA